MLDTKDIKKLTEYLLEAFKDVFATKEDIGDLKRDVSKLTGIVEKSLKDEKNNSDEILVLNSRVKNTEDWIDQAAPKVGVQFKH